MFPVEILTRIFQDVEWTSLKDCSLASKAFLPVARSILFERAVLHLEPKPNRVDVQSGPEDDFFKFLLESDDHHDTTLGGDPAASYIRQLTLDQRPLNTMVNDTTDHWQSTAENLRRLLPKLTRLKRLSVESDFYSDWTLKIRAEVLEFCLRPSVQILQLSFLRLQQTELLSFTSIPKITLFCVDVFPESSTSSPGPSTTSTSSSTSTSSVRLEDLAITLRYSENPHSPVWSIVRAAGSKLTSLRIYSSPYIDNLIPSLDGIDLSQHPTLQHFSIGISFISNDCITDLASIFDTCSLSSTTATATATASSKIKCIEICCDVDTYSFPSQETIDAWDWVRLDGILSSDTFGELERLEITVKKVVRSRVSWERQRKYKELEQKVVEMFTNQLLSVISQSALMVVAGQSVEDDS